MILRTKVMIYNLKASTSVTFRINCIVVQLNSNADNALNPATKKIIKGIVSRMYTNMESANATEHTPDYFGYCDRCISIMNEGKTFISQLMELMKKNTYEYDLLKYTVKVLDQVDYVLGNDELDELEN